MKLIFALFYIIYSFNLFANDLSDDEHARISMKSAVIDFNDLKTAGSPLSAECDNYGVVTPKYYPPLDPVFTDGGTQCDKFISTSIEGHGTYGPWGEVVVSYLREKGHASEFLKDNITKIDKICPSWKKLTRKQREFAWVWTIASIAKVESTCNPKARNGNATNGTGVGLLQLEEKKAARSWRGEACKMPSVLIPENNIKCGMDIMEEILKGKEGDYKSSGAIYGKDSHSYWQHLRKSDGGGIVDLMSLNPLCHKK